MVIIVVQSVCIVVLTLAVGVLLCYIQKLSNDAIEVENNAMEQITSAYWCHQQRLERVAEALVVGAVQSLTLKHPLFEMGRLTTDSVYRVWYRGTPSRIVFHFYMEGEYCYFSVYTRQGVQETIFHLSEVSKMFEMVQCIVSFPEMVEK